MKFVSERNLTGETVCHFVHYKSHTNSPVIEPRHSRQETGGYPPGLSHSPKNILAFHDHRSEKLKFKPK
jgi:hypothetical protein